MQGLPELIRPMLAVPGPLPYARRDHEYGYELKWDGVRTVGYFGGGRPRLMSRNDRDVLVSYPELVELESAVGDQRMVLDGEIVALDAAGRPSFGQLQQRMHVADPKQAARLAATKPVNYLFFDLLFMDGRDLTELPYTARRELLEALELRAPRWDAPPYFEGGGRDALEVSRRQGLEGIVAKRLDSVYQPGRRSPDWIKVKIFRTQEVVVGGWKPGQGGRSRTFGSLLIGIPDQKGGLDYVGHVGTGFTERVLAALWARLRALEQAGSPFTSEVPAKDAKDAHWVRPELVGEVAFGEWTPDGRLRHPSWRGLRPDKDPGAVVRE
jgi:bifunctional non-homologous end joining protein LigD